MQMIPDPGFVAWQRSLCNSLKIGGKWGIPQTGAILSRLDTQTFCFDTLGPVGAREETVYLSAMVVAYIKAAGFRVQLPEVVRCAVDDALLTRVTDLLADYSLASVLDAIVKSKEQKNQQKLDELKVVTDKPCELPEKQIEYASRLEKLYTALVDAKTIGAGL